MVYQTGESSKQEEREGTPSPPEAELPADHPDTFDYKDVIVVLISWDTGVDGNIEQSDNLEEVFRKYYNYKTLKLLIPCPLNPQFHLYRAFSNTLQEHTAKLSSRKTLLIISYIGHGSLNKSSQSFEFKGLHPTLYIAREGMEGNQTSDRPMPWDPQNEYLEWTNFQNVLEDLECDVLVLMDACFSGATTLRRNFEDSSTLKRTRKEVIAAGGFGDESLAPVLKKNCQLDKLGMGLKVLDLAKDYTFTARLVAALKYLATKESTFTASELALRAANNVIHKTFELGNTGILANWGVKLPHPVHAVLVGSPYLPSIPLRPLGLTDGQMGYAKALQEAGDDLNDISRQKEIEEKELMTESNTEGDSAGPEPQETTIEAQSDQGPQSKDPENNASLVTPKPKTSKTKDTYEEGKKGATNEEPKVGVPKQADDDRESSEDRAGEEEAKDEGAKEKREEVLKPVTLNERRPRD